jgi:GT2 family glycosyltransferase
VKVSVEPKTNNLPLVFVIVLNWNNAKDTIECIESLESSDYDRISATLVDNGSTDGSVAMVREKFPNLSIIELEKNMGYAEGNNVGIKGALESGADYVLILNNDTIVSESMIRELVTLAESNSSIGMTGPKMYCYEPEDTIFALGSFVDWPDGKTRNRGMFLSESAVDIPITAEKVDFIAGCCVLVSRKMLEKVGLIDPDYFLNYEDVDWGIRAWREGFEVWFTPDAVLWHKISATMGQASPLNTYYMTRNALHFFWNKSPPRYRLRATSRIILRTLRTIVTWSVLPKYWTENYKNLRKANFNALVDFGRGKYGEMAKG